jgi:FkbM family methyltransferase
MKNINFKKDKSQIYIHHIGGKGGSIDFPVLPKFKKEIDYIIYDADQDCIDDIKKLWKDYNATIKPFCLFRKDEIIKMNINHDTFANSIYDLNPEFGNYYHKGHDGVTDHVYSGAIKTYKTIDIQTNQLDTLVQKNKVPEPDFISLSCAGAELPVLEGSINCLKKSVVGVFCRVHFSEKWKNAPLFSELDHFMKKNNFILTSISSNLSGYKRAPKIARGVGHALTGNALYILNPERITVNDNLELIRKLEKISLVALNFGHTELAYDVINKCVKSGLNYEKNYLYQKFLYEFYNEIKKNKNLPELWHEKWSIDEVKELSNFSNLKRRKSKLQVLVIKLIKRIISFFPFKFTIVRKNNGFEKFLLKNGFKNLVKILKNRDKY